MWAGVSNATQGSVPGSGQSGVRQESWKARTPGKISRGAIRPARARVRGSWTGEGRTAARGRGHRRDTRAMTPQPCPSLPVPAGPEGPVRGSPSGGDRRLQLLRFAVRWQPGPAVLYWSSWETLKYSFDFVVVGGSPWTGAW